MHTKKVTLSDILTGERRHVIPVYQRMYSWTKKDWQALWTDIQALTEEADKGYEHFLGPIIVDQNTLPYDIEQYLVIDGQQRLATLSMILCALRNLARRRKLKALELSINSYLSFNTTRGDVEYKLILRSQDRETFVKVIEDRIGSDDNKEQLVKTFKFFMTEIRRDLPDDEENAFNYLNDLFSTLKTRLKMVSISLESNDDPTKIYESMNSTGTKLLVSDLIRNYVLMHIPVNDQAFAQSAFFNKEWEPFEQQFTDSKTEKLDNRELEDFYYRYLINKRGYFAKRLVYAAYKKEMQAYTAKHRPSVDNYHSLRILAADQSRYAQYYRRIVHPQYEHDSLLREAFERFGMLDATTAIPFVMSLYARYENASSAAHINKSTFLAMLNAMESFVIRRSLLRLRTRGYGLDFAQASDEASDLESLYKFFAKREWPNDAEVIEILMSFPIYRREPKKTRLILTELEKNYGHKEMVDLSDPKKIQIEHIMPQQPTKEWDETLGADALSIRKKYLDAIGNLTLSGYNSELAARSFADKKREYQKHGSGSHLELNTFVLSQETWTEREILQRAKQMAAQFVKIWRRPELN